MLLPLTPVRFLLHAAREYPDKVGVVDRDKRLTYKQLLDRASRLAAVIESLGLESGGRVASLSFNCHQLLELYYGMPMSGRVLLSLNVRLSAEEQSYILQHSGSKAVLFDPEFLPLAEQLRQDLPHLRWIALEPLDEQPDWVEADYEDLLASHEPAQVDFTKIDENSPAELFYTSGSTGQPKGVVLNHRTLYLHAMYSVLGTLRRGGGVAGDRLVELHTIPLFHANGWGRPHSITMLGGRHVMMKRFVPEDVFRLIEAEGVTGFSLVPTMGTALVHCPERDKYDVSSVDDIMIGGAASSPTLIGQLESLFGASACAGWGLTETSPVGTIAQIKSTLPELTDEERIRRQATTGFAIPMVELRVADPDAQTLPRDNTSIGEILVRSDTVMDGYWNEPEATAEVMTGDWLHTGDMAVWDEHNYVTIVDRKKDIIISGGENISTLEIEKVLVAHAAVYEAAVVGVPDEKWGEAVLAVVALQEGQSATEDELRGHVRDHLAGFKVPRTVEFVDALPKGPTGKILKRVIREPYWEGHEKRISGTGE